MTVPETEKDSLFTKPLYAGVPVTDTVVVPSKFLSEAVKPVMVRVFVPTELARVCSR